MDNEGSSSQRLHQIPSLKRKKITNNNYYRNRMKIKLTAHYERALKFLIINISKSITEFPVMKWGKTTSKLQCIKRGKYHKRTSKCVSHVLPCTLLTPMTKLNSNEGNFRAQLTFIGLSHKPCKFICNPYLHPNQYNDHHMH